MRFTHGRDELVARIAKTPADGDGYNVEVYCCALPSRFYKVRALPTPNSMNEARPGFTLSTGSGMARFALEFAKHAAEGMLGMRSDGVAPSPVPENPTPIPRQKFNTSGVQAPPQPQPEKPE